MLARAGNLQNFSAMEPDARRSRAPVQLGLAPVGVLCAVSGGARLVGAPAALIDDPSSSPAALFEAFAR